MFARLRGFEDTLSKSLQFHTACDAPAFPRDLTAGITARLDTLPLAPAPGSALLADLRVAGEPGMVLAAPPFMRGVNLASTIRRITPDDIRNGEQHSPPVREIPNGLARQWQILEEDRVSPKEYVHL